MDQDKSFIRREREEDRLFTIGEDGNIITTYEDEIRIANHHALGNHIFQQSKGDKKQKNASINIDKVSDGTVRLLQKEFKESYNYLEIRKKALNILEDENFFEEYGLTDEKIEKLPNKTAKAERRDVKRVVIESRMRDIVADSMYKKNKIKVPLHLFFEIMKIASVYKEGKLNLTRAIKTIEEIQDRATTLSTVERVEINTETKEIMIEKELSRTKSVPKISFIVDGDCEFNSIEDLKLSRKHNKEQYVKYMEIEFDIATYVDKVAPLMNYITAVPSIRDSYSTSYSRSFDAWMRSLYGLQGYKNVNTYTFKELLEKWGLSYALYSNFKRKVLVPVINDFNKNIDMKVEMIETFNGNKLSHVSFKITKIGNDGCEEDEKNNYLDIVYYVAVQHTFSDLYIESDLDFEEHYKEIRMYLLNSKKYENIKYCPDCKNDKTFKEWEEEHIEAIRAFEKLQFAEFRDTEWFSNRNLKLCIKKLCLVDRETEDICTIIGGEVKLHNPIRSYKYYLDATKGNG